jgi:UPF0042 nucleotide-binding protein
MSGAGRSEAARALEDTGWFVIDNLPPALISKMLSLTLAPGNRINRVALVIDARGGAFFNEAAKAIDQLRRGVRSFRLVFLTASDGVLVRRFDATRRRHPLAPEGRVLDGIKSERELMDPIREDSDLIIDSSELSVHELRARVSRYFEKEVNDGDDLNTTVVSFGYKYGLPLDADLVFDVRFLPNPHWIESLRPKSGLEQEVRDFVLGRDGAKEFVATVTDLMKVLVPGYRSEGRHYLTIAIGCTGGRHRSVALSEELARSLTEALELPVQVVHRDVDQQASQVAT